METYKHNLEPPEAVRTINEAFAKACIEIYAVGGCVRDKLLGKKVKDWDMATSATPDVVKDVLSNYRNTKNPHGIHFFGKGESFGVISAMPWVGDHTKKQGRGQHTQEIEIATFRKDIGKGRRPDSVEFTDMEEDAKRRDLTINGMYYRRRVIYDFFGGYEDINRHRVRCIGDPMDRFEEDPLRVIRFVRFYSMLNERSDYLSRVDSDHQKAISHFVELGLPGVSPERIRQEFMSGSERSIRKSTFYSILGCTGLLDLAFDGLKVCKDPIPEMSIPIHIAWILKNNPWKEISKKLNELKYTSEECKKISFLVRLKEELNPKDLENAYRLKKYQERNAIDFSMEMDIMSWGSLVGIDDRFLNFFMHYTPCRCANEVPGTAGLEGAEIGKRMKEYELDRMQELWRQHRY